MPEYVQRAFVAAEDKRFYQHKGIDERGLIRAFITNIAEPGRPQGGSTITQQVAKNLLVGDDVSYERKIREMIVASRIDQGLSKDEILEIYLNSIYLGRGAWGIDTPRRSYFKKPASALSVTEGAMLAAMAKGPSVLQPDRYPERTRERFAYVLKRMQEDKIAGAEGSTPASPACRASCLTSGRGARRASTSSTICCARPRRWSACSR
jgi:membrane peptidoglycan carboxypeptidase